jgi:Flp pilus assembly protein TadD
MAAQFPDSPVVQAEVARLRLARGDRAGARRALTDALASGPGNAAAVEGLVVIELQDKRKDAARRRLDDAVASAPGNAELQLLATRLYATTFGDTAAAERAVRRAIDADDGNLGAFDMLARLHVAKDDLPAATKEFERLAEKQPRSVASHTAVGLLHHLQGNLDNAKAGYERALALNPRSPTAANNLAQLYADRNENLDVALQLALTAKAGLPTAHEVDDTIGFLYCRKGQGELALPPLKAAVAAQPSNPAYLYHLGLAHALLKDRTSARQALEKALAAGPFEGADDARRMLESLKGS